MTSKQHLMEVIFVFQQEYLDPKIMSSRNTEVDTACLIVVWKL